MKEIKATLDTASMEGYLLSQSLLPASLTHRWAAAFATLRTDPGLRVVALKQAEKLAHEGWQHSEAAFFWAGVVEDSVNADEQLSQTESLDDESKVPRPTRFAVASLSR